MDEAADLLGRDLEDKLLERIVAKYLYYRRGHEFVVVGGCDARHLPNDWPANMDTKARPSSHHLSPPCLFLTMRCACYFSPSPEKCKPAREEGGGGSAGPVLSVTAEFPSGQLSMPRRTMRQNERPGCTGSETFTHHHGQSLSRWLHALS
jgi:hypothetical protein